MCLWRPETANARVDSTCGLARHLPSQLVWDQWVPTHLPHQTLWYTTQVVHSQWTLMISGFGWWLLTHKCLFFSWKGEEDCCGATWETVSMRGWVRPLVGANCKSYKKKTQLFNTQLFSVELRSNHRHLMRSSSRWPASQRQVSGLFQVWKVPRVRHIPSADWCLHVAAQDQETANTAALKSTSTTAASRGLTWTRDALQSCLSSLAPETAF